MVGESLASAMDLPAELEDLRRFHGHLGIYVTLGLRMGTIGHRTFGHYKGLTARVRSAPKPPMLCVVDGIQFSSGCTMGKGNIAVEAAEEPEVTFEKEGRRLRVALKPGWRERIDQEMSHETELERSVFYFRLPEEQLFDVREA